MGRNPVLGSRDGTAGRLAVAWGAASASGHGRDQAQLVALLQSLRLVTCDGPQVPPGDGDQTTPRKTVARREQVRQSGQRVIDGAAFGQQQFVRQMGDGVVAATGDQEADLHNALAGSRLLVGYAGTPRQQGQWGFLANRTVVARP